MYFFHCSWADSINAKKMVRLIYFKSKRESVSEVFEDIIILTVHELYVYEVIKLLCKSVNNLSTTVFLKDSYKLNSVKNVLGVIDCSLLQFNRSDQRSILFRSSTETVNFWIFWVEKFRFQKILAEWKTAM